MIKDSMLIYKSYNNNSLKCISCITKDHFLYDCPALHFIPDSNFLISKYLYNEPHLHRRKIKRENKKSINSLLLKQEINNAIKQFKLNNLTMNESENGEIYSEIETLSEPSFINQNNESENNTQSSKETNEKRKISREINRDSSLTQIDNQGEENIKNDFSTNFINIKLENSIDNNKNINNKNQEENNLLENVPIKDKKNFSDIFISEKKNDLFFKEFEYMKNYLNYFSHNNADKIIHNQETNISSRYLSRKFSKSKIWKKNKYYNSKEYSNLGLVIKMKQNEKKIENKSELCLSPKFIGSKKRFFGVE